MPTVPGGTGSDGMSPLSAGQGPSDNDLLMAAASLHAKGMLAPPDPARSMPSAKSAQPNPTKQRNRRKLKVIK